ncbi:hypothetical protein [Endozoicomonas euniceicola]|uniref:TPM domain-containing protein n=1 Tax=Endozoicomonas euniceicola TaxID=1234143 RepID=A0ABY6GSS7_9GAMM|nr:hypothetical protein [Endozoicomonas euniceicola]UYM15444.1 hypothetical protein NX720_21750 [Endozoicomonas euniceicola]
MKDSLLISFIIRALTLIILFFSLSGTAQQLPRKHTQTPNTSNEAQTLDDLCNSSIESGGRLNESIQTAAATILNNIQKQFPFNQISRCVMLFPDGKPIDETIGEYNRNRIPEDKKNTVFLMVGPGVRTELTNPAHRDQGLIMVDARGARRTLQAHWQKSYKVNQTITLEKGQKLVGIPLTTDAKLANDFYIGLERMWENSESDTSKKDSLIDSNATGILISGLSNAPAFLSTPYELKPSEQATKSISASSSLLSFEIKQNSDKLDIQPEKNIINIFNSELVQPAGQSINIFATENFLFHEKKYDQALFNIKGSHFFSYGQSVTDNPVFLTTDTHTSNSEYNQKVGTYLKLENNHFFGECKRNIVSRVDNIKNYVAYNNRFICWINGDNPADLKLKNNFMATDFLTYGSSNPVTRYISYEDGNRFKGAIYLPDVIPLSGSGHSDAKHHRRRFVRETGQRDNEKTDTSHNTQASNNNQKTVVYISLGIAVLSLGVATISMTYSFLNRVKIRSLENALRPPPASHVPQVPGQHRYQLVHNPPGHGNDCQQVMMSPAHDPLVVRPNTPVRTLPVRTRNSLISHSGASRSRKKKSIQMSDASFDDVFD